MKSDAWFLYAGSRQDDGDSRLVRESFELEDPGADEVIAEPLYGAWEGNMGHALARKPLDVCKHRREERVILGNSGVVRVLECGSGVTRLAPGDVAVLFCGADPDPHGYPQRILGYDAPKTMGCLATRIKVSERNLITLPNVSVESLPRWAAFSLRYITAWSNFALALRVYRCLVPESSDPHPNVWGWGGGTTLAELDLARRFGCKVAMLSGNEQRLQTIARSSIRPIDRRIFGDLTFEEARGNKDPDYRRAYARAEAHFIRTVDEVTDGRRVQIFVDNIGTPVFRATARALSREGIITTCGWKEGMQIEYLRAVACVGRQQHVNTHYARFDEGLEAVRYAQANDWLPPIEGRIYSFDDIPQLAHDYEDGNVGIFPVYSVNRVS